MRGLALLKMLESPGEYPAKPAKPPETGQMGGFAGFAVSSEGVIAKNVTQGDALVSAVELEVGQHPKGGFAGFAGSIPALVEKFEAPQEAANDDHGQAPAEVGEVQKPHFTTTAEAKQPHASEPAKPHQKEVFAPEVQAIAARLERWGLGEERTLKAAKELYERDVQWLDMSMCLECRHLTARRACTNPIGAELAIKPGVVQLGALIDRLQRCPGFVSINATKAARSTTRLLQNLNPNHRLIDEVSVVAVAARVALKTSALQTKELS